ncbi:MAG: zinc ABC transporter substrate-binding protein [Verrucomicrobiota bacterium]|nr:zinc ABC transporter substrate-binding protein [Verrucomicrobiota bacterium]
MKTLILLLSLLCATCSSAAEKKLTVCATVSMVADLTRSVGGERVEVQALMGAGVDPHLYKATASDIVKLQKADLILYSGLMLEGKMEGLFEQMKKGKRAVYAVTANLPKEKLLTPPEFEGHHDPHVWFDVELWAACIGTVEEALSKVDPKGKEYYAANGAALRQKYAQLHAWALNRVSDLAKEQRILVTSHDAYNYFGRAYGFQVVGLQGISTVTEAGLADVTKLVDFVKQKKIKAIFVESSVPHNTIERISKDAGVKIGGELFSDAMGSPGQMEGDYDVGTYEGMIKHNINTIVTGLK